MNSQPPKSSLRIGTHGLLIATVVIAVLISWFLYVQRPIRNARKIRPGDSVQRVYQLLGQPESTFESDAELRQSDLVPMSFVFTDTTNTTSDVAVSQLPMVSNRAEWFPIGPTAGHLVYYDEDGVEIVFWGGT
ncbi:hypothetical protein OAU26_08930 [Mariniblastus sp.]|nr:hypothetical protein [Mariniblastus sp.]MDC3225045.1 hypothetical protein [Mariniblastus sp.]